MRMRRKAIRRKGSSKFNLGLRSVIKFSKKRSLKNEEYEFIMSKASERIKKRKKFTFNRMRF